MGVRSGPDAVLHRITCRVRALAPIRLEAAGAVPKRLKRRGVYLITGGLGQIGLEIAEFLVAKAKARVVLTGRSSLPDQAAWTDWVETRDDNDATYRAPLLALRPAAAPPIRDP